MLGVCRVHRHQFREGEEDEEKGSCNGADSNCADDGLWKTFAKKPKQQEAKQREGRNEPKVHVRCLEFHGIDFVDLKRTARLEDGKNNGESDGGFSGSDHHDEEGINVSIDALPLV